MAAATAAVVAVMAFPCTPAFADSIRGMQWHLSDLKVAQAQKITTGSGVVVALVDTGVYAAHQDLAGAVLPGTDVNAGATGDGRKDLDEHGTTMAGIIAGRGHGSGSGVLGIAPGSKILPIRAPIGIFADDSFMIKAVDFAIAHHAKVMNLSFVSPDTDTLRKAVDKALAADIVVVAGAGNHDDGLLYPGKYPEVLTVGAYGRDGKVASFSDTGDQVDLVAPGVDIVTTGNQGPDGYYKGSGTSEATAVVSGAAALLRAKYPKLSAAEIVHRLTATATDAGPAGRDDSYGYGKLNIVKALTADVAPLPSSSASVSASSDSGGAVAEATPTTAVGDGDLSQSGYMKSVVSFLGAIALVLVLLVLVVVFIVRAARRRRGRELQGRQQPPGPWA